MKYVTLVCNECGVGFEKPKPHYDLRVKAGYNKFYCSIRCGNLFNKGMHGPSFRPVNPFKWYVRLARRRSKKKNFITDLTVNYLSLLWEEQKGICPLTGWKLTLPEGSSSWSEDKPFSISSASLDRIDNTKGYLQGNIRFVAVMANYARNQFSDEELIKFAKAVVEHQHIGL